MSSSSSRSGSLRVSRAKGRSRAEFPLLESGALSDGPGFESPTRALIGSLARRESIGGGSCKPSSVRRDGVVWFDGQSMRVAFRRLSSRS